MSESEEAQLWADLAEQYEAEAFRQDYKANLHKIEAQRCRQEAKEAREISKRKAMRIHAQRYLRVVN